MKKPPGGGGIHPPSAEPVAQHGLTDKPEALPPDGPVYPPDLAALIERWAALPPAIRTAIAALVASTDPEH